jgi:hypothetical protein
MTYELLFMSRNLNPTPVCHLPDPARRELIFAAAALEAMNRVAEKCA